MTFSCQNGLTDKYSRYDAFPGSGTVTRIEAGWPPLKKQPIAAPRSPPSEEDLNVFESYLENEVLQKQIYAHWGEIRDVDIGYFQKWLDTVLARNLGWTQSRFMNVVIGGAKKKRDNWV